MPFDSLVTQPEAIAALNKFSLCNVEVGLFPTGNRQATFSTPTQSRSESCIAINPKNSRNMVGSSKKFIDPKVYRFRLGVNYTFDSGQTWQESELPIKPGWDCMTDPALAFDDFGNAFLIAEALKFNADKVGTHEDLTGLGMVAYRSKDGGKTWENPIQLTTDTRDDKQWVVCDNNPYSPFYGNVYAAWGAYSPLRFARSTDHGNSWKGKGNEASGSTLVSYSFAPEMSVSPDGTLHILFQTVDSSKEIRYLRSTDGGETFAPAETAVTGMTPLRGNLPEINQWPHFDHGRFRVITLVTDCVASKSLLVVAWADMREGRSRIYYRRSLDNGITWQGHESGQPLLPNVVYGDLHCFHPQIIATGTGVIGCAFYVFGKEFQNHLIRVQLAASWDNGATFSHFITVTERSWDPLVNAPAVHGMKGVDFIGEYFGLDADDENFALLWTDTRTGVQELFSDVVHTKRIKCPRIPDLVGDILAGVTSDGGGLIIVGGKIVKVPPRSPILKVLNALVALDAVSEVQEKALDQLKLATLESITDTLAIKVERKRSSEKKTSKKPKR